MTTEELEKRILTLEAKLTFIRGAAAVTAACVLAFLGYTIIEIPKQVSAKVEEKIGKDTESHAKEINAEYEKLKENSDSLAKKVVQDLPFEIVGVHRFFRHGGFNSHVFAVDNFAELNGWDDQGIKFYALKKKR